MPGLLLLASLIYTISVTHVDVKAIGPENTDVGFAALNGAVAGLLPYNSVWYTISKLLGIVAMLLMLFFGFLFLLQIITRKGIFKADKDLYALMIFYLLVVITYVLFEVLKLNYRPVILKEEIEASYPSSHTLIGVCGFLSAAMQFKKRIDDKLLNRILVTVCCVLMVLLILARTLSGVHWITDIVGGLLISAFLISIYQIIEK